MSNTQNVEIVNLEEVKFVGIPVTSVFEGHNPQRIEEVKDLFKNRRHEIKKVINSNQYFCPGFASETLFTYFFCMEVSEITDIPDGMLGFTIPAHNYGKTRSDKDPYEIIHTYFKENGMVSNKKAVAIEVYQFEDPVWPSKVDVYVPLKD